MIQPSSKRALLRNSLIIATLVLSSGVYAANEKSTAIVPLDTVVAVVNDQVITASQLSQQEDLIKKQLAGSNTRLPSEAQFRRQVLQHMIDTTLQMQIAKSAGITVSDEDLDKTISQIAAQNNLTLAQMPAKLAQQGMNYQQYRNEIRNEMTIAQVEQRAIGSSIVITPQEVNDMLGAVKKNDLTGNTQSVMGAYHLKDILISLPDTPTPDQIDQAKKQAVAVVAKLRAGADFSQTAVGLSQDQNALQGGDLGWRKLAELPDPFIAYVKTMQPGDIAGPIRTPNGFHIIKLIEAQGLNPLSEKHVITEAQVRVILLKNNPLLTDQQMQDQAKSVKEDILAGQDFAKAVEINSQDAASINHGGNLGWVQPGMLPEGLDQSIAQLKLKQISDPVKTSQGWYIVQVLARRQVQQNKQDFINTQVREMIYKRKFNEAVQNWVQRLRSQSFVKVMGEEGNA
jgi:peptidyl-prolyl cis-trans isomerase SurA